MPIHPQRTFELSDAQVGEVMQAARHTMELDLRSAATAAGIDWRVLSRVERGERPCRVTELFALAEVYLLSPEVLIRAIGSDEKAWAKVVRKRRKRT